MLDWFLPSLEHSSDRFYILISMSLVFHSIKWDSLIYCNWICMHAFSLEHIEQWFLHFTWIFQLRTHCIFLILNTSALWWIKYDMQFWHFYHEKIYISITTATALLHSTPLNIKLVWHIHCTQKDVAPKTFVCFSQVLFHFMGIEMLSYSMCLVHSHDIW